MELNKAELDLATAELQAIVLQVEQLITSIPVGALSPEQTEPIKTQLETISTSLKSTNDRLVSLGIEPEAPPPPPPPAADTESVDDGTVDPDTM
jgi:hypothetical protein